MTQSLSIAKDEKASRLRSVNRRVTIWLDRLSEKRRLAYFIYSTSILFFFGIILIPSLLGIFLKLDAVQEVISNPKLLESSVSAVLSSILMAGLVSILDVAAGLPLAWIIAKRKYRWIAAIDSLVDLPLIVPTVILGYSALLIWCEETPFRCLDSPHFRPGSSWFYYCTSLSHIL